MKQALTYKALLIISALAMISHIGSANERLFNEARSLQRSGQFDQAILAYKSYLSQPMSESDLKGKQLAMYTDALVQLMNTYQSKGEPESCTKVLNEVFESSPAFQTLCLRDYYSVLGYALSRTENMADAEFYMLRALKLPLYEGTPERYFRDYAYAAAVFYSNPDYYNDVISWCREALNQAKLSVNTSGQQWVTAMLGSLYKRGGKLNEALELFQASKKESESRNDELGVLNSLHSMTDLFLYWNIPEYADMYASEAILVEKKMSAQNPMVSAQTYLNKARALDLLEERDSITFYIDYAKKFCESLPYNSGMVDVNLLNGIYLTEKGGDSAEVGIRELKTVTAQGTDANRAKAYHQLAQTFLGQDRDKEAEMMLDSLYVLLARIHSPNLIRLNYKSILDHYLRANNTEKVQQYVQMMLHEQQAMKEMKLNHNLVEAIVDLQTGKSIQELKIMQLKQANQHLLLLISIVISVIVIAFLLYQRKHHKTQMKNADEKVKGLIQRMNELNTEKDRVTQEINDFLNNKDKRQELETLTPYILKESGEIKFRHCFDMLYPLFLHRLRERVPAVTRREELLSMLIALKQNNKQIAELFAIETSSVLMLRHRFRQKIGMNQDISLENFIEDLLA